MLVPETATNIHQRTSLVVLREINLKFSRFCDSWLLMKTMYGIQMSLADGIEMVLDLAADYAAAFLMEIRAVLEQFS
jgi:hypothetical protein